MIRLLDAAAVVLVLALLAGLTLAYRWVYVTPPMGKTEIVEAEIVGFSGFLVRPEFRNVVLGSVRMPNGRIQQVGWPRRASHCRKGDTVRLIKYGVRLKVYRDGCIRPPRS